MVNIPKFSEQEQSLSIVRRASRVIRVSMLVIGICYKGYFRFCIEFYFFFFLNDEKPLKGMVTSCTNLCRVPRIRAKRHQHTDQIILMLH
jgi:hypothetical protein